MRRKGGIDLLVEQAVSYVEGEVSASYEDAAGDTEIEKLLFHAICTVVRVGSCEYDNVVIPEQFQQPVSVIQEHHRTWLIIEPQKQFEWGRVDFLLHSYSWGVFTKRAEGWHRLVVECDGHDFHERTKEQAAKDRNRDREAQLGGLPVFRFTGSEIWRDPWGCAEKVIQWAQQGL